MRSRRNRATLHLLLIVVIISMVSLVESLQSDRNTSCAFDKSKSLLSLSNMFSINGTRYNDSNSNGLMDEGEKGLAGTIIYLKQNGIEISKVVTNENGHYFFNGLTPGQYTVVEEHVKGWSPISPLGGSYNVTLVNMSIEHLDFGDAGGISASGPYTVMHFTPEELRNAIKIYENLPPVNISPKALAQVKQPPTAGEHFSLLNYLTYVPPDRSQGSCGNCWVWGSTPLMEIDNAVNNNIYDRLSIQYFSSNYNGGTGCGFDCCGGWPEWVAAFYSGTKKSIPWSNENAGPFADMGRCCSRACDSNGCDPGTTLVAANTITETPNYPLSYINCRRAYPINADQQTAINYIKALLKQNKAVTFTFFQASSAFGTYWGNQGESDIFTPTGATDCNIGSGNAWGHVVTCVGYDDTNPSNPYWIMLNSWGNPSNRPNGLFAVTMNLDYSCSDFQFETFDISWIDKFGYTFLDSNAQSGPTYSWIEISGDGTKILTQSDDGSVSNIPVGFSFNYYGTSYDQIRISANGYLNFGPSTSTYDYTNMPIRQSTFVDGIVAPFWDDLITVGNSGAVYYKIIGTAPNRKFIVEWKDVMHFSSTPNGITFEAILYEGSNNILFQYSNTAFGSSDDFGGSATVGIESSDGADGLQYSYDVQKINPNLAILFKCPQSSSQVGLMSFARGSDADGNLWYRKWDGTSWGGWVGLGGPVTLIDTASIGSNVFAFARGSNTDGNLWYRKWDGSSWGGWVGLGGPVTLIDTVSVGSNLYTFARGSNTDGNLWYRKWDGSSWGGWVGLGGPITLLDTASVGSNVFAFARGSNTDGNLWYRKWDGSSWSGWVGLGGPITLLDTASVGSNLFAFARGSNTDGNLWYRKWDGSSWSGWVALGGPVTLIDAASVGSNLFVFARGSNTDGNLWYRKWDGTSWSGWVGLGGPVTLIDTASVGSNLYAFARGSTAAGNQLWYRKWDGSSWSGWVGLGGPVTLIDESPIA